ncbi:MAG TPA: M1 family metallopeptidase [Pyrinomonadaceae bacterium]|nr:M1 family metallopeptidase [Pyrinomonadaceae bacterium]
MKRLVLVAAFLCLITFGQVPTQSTPQSSGAFDVIDYNLRLEPDIDRKSLTGKESIKLLALTTNLTEIEFNCGELTIDSVKEKGVAQNFVRRDRKLIISLDRPARRNETRELEIEYHGTPRRGIRFFPERQQVYTIFSTSQWMVCVDEPDDRATFRLNLILPATVTGVANGRMLGRRTLANNKISHEWRQESPIPSYVFGFSVGKFRTVSERHGHVELRYLSEQYTNDELRRIFRDTADMIDFYEDRAGVKYADPVYTQVLAAGGVEQEMSSFTALRETYGRDVLANERAIWLGAHELAHQWWGNMVTNRYWTHFWLNEGIASFMASAYKEDRFGREEYMKDIAEYRANYEKVRDAGKDRSLVFPDWNSPTREDRTLVYDKGAYVLHLLREELGERAFWAGIRQYTRKYFGKSVVTADFQREMEAASNRSLREFFDRWIYLRQT